MEKPRNIAKTAGGTLVVVVFIYILLIIGSAIPLLFWLATLLVGIIILIFNVANIKGISWNLGPRALIIINFSIVVFLVALYFFIFGLSSGFYLSAITLGIPIFIGVVFLIVDTIYLIRKDSMGTVYLTRKDSKRGMFGFSFGLGAYAYIAIMLIFCSHHMLAPPQSPPGEVVNQEENKMLDLAFIELFSRDTGCVIISPETTMNNGEYDDDCLEQMKEEIFRHSSYYLKSYAYYFFENENASLAIEKTAFEELVNRFIEENRSPHTLSIPSSMERGYYVDYGKRYSWYPSPIWRLTHPMDGPIVSVSSPVCDDKSGFMIIYVGTNDKTIYFLKYRNGFIETVDSFKVFL